MEPNKGNKSIAAFLLHSIGDTGDRTEEFTKKEHFLASVRLRIKPAMEAAQLLGYEPKIYILRSEHPEDLDQLISIEPKLAVIGKLTHPNKETYMKIRMANLAALSYLKWKKIPTLVDYSDNLISSTGSKGMFYKLLLDNSDLITVPSESMLGLLDSKYKFKSRIIEDPLESMFKEPSKLDIKEQIKSAGGLNLMWFGHSTNVQYLFLWLQKLWEKKWPFQMNLQIIATQLDCLSIKNWLAEAKNPSSKWRYTLTYYTKQKDVLKSFPANHLVLIPSDKNSTRKKGASHNRVSESLNSGKLVLAEKLPSYLELLPKEMLVDSEDTIVDNLILLLDRWSKMSQWLEEYQPQLESRFNKDKILRDWILCLEKLIKLKAE